LRRDIIAFDGAAILAELRRKCAPRTAHLRPPVRRRWWHSSPVIPRRLYARAPHYALIWLAVRKNSHLLVKLRAATLESQSRFRRERESDLAIQSRIFSYSHFLSFGSFHGERSGVSPNHAAERQVSSSDSEKFPRRAADNHSCLPFFFIFFTHPRESPQGTSLTRGVRKRVRCGRQLTLPSPRILA